MEVLDLFSGAAGGWSLGMHRAGFRTIAACEFVEWRRILYAENNPGVTIYEDVRELTADRLRRDLGRLPTVIVGSPPCQDISSANTKGKGVEGERSGLYFEAIRLIGEIRPRWFALENSANLRTRGADAVLAALEELDYTCWPLVVRARDVGANHERPRSWLVGCDLEQLTDADSYAIRQPILSERSFAKTAFARNDAGNATEDGLRQGLPGRRSGAIAGAEQSACGDAAYAYRQGQHAPCPGQMGLCEADRLNALWCRPDWSLNDLADHLRLDDGLSSWVAGARVAVGGPKGTAAASLIVEAFGDAVIPQIPEAIGRAILRTEAALAAVYGREAA